MKEYINDLINKIGNILLVIVLTLALLIHIGGNELIIKKDLFQFGKKVIKIMNDDDWRNQQ